MSGLSTRQHYSEIQDMILSVTKSEKIKYSWKRSSSVFNMMGITFHYTAIHQKQKTKTKNLLAVLQYTFNWTTAEQIEMGHHQWNGVLKMYRCMLWHSFMKKNNTYTCMYSHSMQCKWTYMCIHLHTWDVDLPQLKKKKNTKMPKIVEVGLHCGHARYFAER